MICRGALALIAIVAAGVLSAAAPFDDDLAEEPPAAPEQGMIQFDARQVDQWIFSTWGDAASCRRRLDECLELRIDAIVTQCVATNEQQTTLRLAGRGDVRRFFDRVAELKKKFELVKNNRNRFGDIWQEVQPLQTDLNSGLFGEDSLFEKTARTILTAEQAASMRHADRERREFRYHHAVEQVVLMLDDGLGLGDDQRQKLVALLLAETRPPRRLGQYDLQVVMVQFSRLPDEKLRSLLDESQWRALRNQLDQARGYEQFLIKQGLIPERDKKNPAADPAPTRKRRG
jgi:Spy/CpxP family protein refolding chaperone